MDNIQGVNYSLLTYGTSNNWRHFIINPELADCPTDTDEPASYRVEASVSQCSAVSNGNVGLNPGTDTAELMQRAQGASVDQNNNGESRVHVKARTASGGTAAAYIFVRDWDGLNEVGCSVALASSYDWYVCDLDLDGNPPDSHWTEYEYGIRCGETFRISAMRTYDNNTAD